VKNNLVSLYEFYLKVDEVVTNNNRYKKNVNAIDDMVVDVNNLARFKRHLQEKDSVKNRNEIETYLVDGCGDLNGDK
jgi:GTP1/Obg family GTP-binding protein